MQVVARDTSLPRTNALTQCEPGRSSVGPLRAVRGTSGMKTLYMPSSAPSECQSCAEADGTLTTHLGRGLGLGLGLRLGPGSGVGVEVGVGVRVGLGSGLE